MGGREKLITIAIRLKICWGMAVSLTASLAANQCGALDSKSLNAALYDI